MINYKDWLKNQPKIVQIMPGDGWHAVFTGQNGQPSTSARVMCFVLVEDREGFRNVEGLGGHDLDQTFFSESPHFDGYVYESELAARLSFLDGL